MVKTKKTKQEIDLLERLARIRAKKQEEKIREDTFQEGSPGYERQQRQLTSLEKREKTRREKKERRDIQTKLMRKGYEKVARTISEVGKAQVGRTGGKAIKAATKMYRAKPKLSQTLLSYGAGFANVSPYGGGQAGGVRPVGRPAGVMKHRSPFTGKPIPAPQFYTEMRAFRRMQTQQADVVQQQQQQRFARQGVPPQQIQNVVEQRMRQQFLQQQPQMQPRPVQQMPPQFQRMPGRPLPKLKFLRDIELQRGPQPFQQKWW